jgi:hypothetical protein
MSIQEDLLFNFWHHKLAQVFLAFCLYLFKSQAVDQKALDPCIEEWYLKRKDSVFKDLLIAT